MDMYYDGALRAINNSIKLIDSITDNTKFEEVSSELHDSLISTVHFVGDVYERIKKNGINHFSQDKKEFLLAFVYLNNQLKHDVLLNVVYYEVSGSMFPFKFPRRFGTPAVYWSDFPDHGQSKKAKREHYDLYLKKKDVRVTLEKLYGLLKEL